MTGEYRDPLATQSFIVDDPTGVYLTSVDIFFQRVPTDESTPVTVQIREVELGTPSQRILYTQRLIKPDEITTSEDASIPTKFTFESPVFLNGQREYVLSSFSPTPPNTQFGSPDLVNPMWPHWVEKKDKSLFLLRDFWVRCISHRTLSVWTPSQYEDLTFQLFKY